MTFRSRTPEAGEIVTFLDPRTTEERVLIKRVIAVGGQTIDLIKGDVYIDGVMIKEPYTLSPGNTFPLQRS
ncbi:MAG: S26 family signal peptidase, partial [Eggerthellaceae bacterium]|nr:S26 family signal peptidase [Eggerthellaceae bacterium]